MNVIKQNGGIAVIQDGDDYFCVGLDAAKGQVFSLGADCPKERNTQWCGSYSRSGLDYVSHARTRKRAMEMFRDATENHTGMP
jgi:hypothetical protein